MLSGIGGWFAGALLLALKALFLEIPALSGLLVRGGVITRNLFGILASAIPVTVLYFALYHVWRDDWPNGSLHWLNAWLHDGWWFKGMVLAAPIFGFFGFVFNPFSAFVPEWADDSVD